MMNQQLHLHGIPPFTRLDAAKKAWLDRKTYWKGLGIQSEIGRADKLTYRRTKGEGDFIGNKFERWGTISIFDPVLTEIFYNWYTAPGMSILDPFAGGSVRGIVASKMGRWYDGVELRKEQVEANVVQRQDILGKKHLPSWHCGDSKHINKIIDRKFDYIFSCPPYGNLEVYSKEVGDISNMTWQDFIEAYRMIIKKTVGLLKSDRFATFVVSDFRDKSTGELKPLVMETILAFQAAGCRYWNETIYLNPLSTLALRANTPMLKSRKFGRAHQNILTFVKGDPVVAAKELNEEGGVTVYSDIHHNDIEDLF